MTTNTFTSFIVGEGTLPIRCAELLLERGHTIHGMITSDETIVRWADSRGIDPMNPKAGLVALVARQPFDYLFSIFNLYVRDRELLKLPRRCAINYHDALLPRYAGMHVTSWALMNQEKVHGITWHVMEWRVDAGAVLKQRVVKIEEGETAFTLNAKCYESAIGAFTELIEELAVGRETRYPQDSSKRSYFSLRKRPPVACGINWNQSAEKIDAFIRALEFGPYPNPLGLPKTAFNGCFIVIPEVELLNTSSGVAPGTLVGINSDSLCVSTATRDVIIRKVLTLEGLPIPFSELASKHGLKEDHRFDSFGPEVSRRIHSLHVAAGRHEQFWVDRLADLLPVDLPYCRRGDPSEPACYRTAEMHVPEAIRKLPGSGDILLAAFASYIGRIAGVSTFDIGFRNALGVHGSAGLEALFAPYVPLRIDLSWAEGINAAVVSIQNRVRELSKHKTYLRDLVARAPRLRSTPGLSRGLPIPVAVERVEKLDGHVSPPAGELILVIPDEGRVCRWVYDTKALADESVARMIKQFSTLLKSIAADPDCPVAKSPLLTEEERHQLVVEWNQTSRGYPQEMCVHQLFEVRVESTPEALAVVFEGERLTYRELNHRANQVAHYLKRHGVGPDVIVGVCMERSLEMVVALLGILKAGGAYLPLDPDYPRERLRSVLEDARVKNLLVDEKSEEGFGNFIGTILCLTPSNALLAAESGQNIAGGVDASCAAYVLYTSGSTGKPKGAVIPHSAICNHMFWICQEFNINESDRVLQKTPYTFDASVWEFFAPLICGGILVMARPGGHADSAYLTRVIRDNSVTLLQVVPSQLQFLLQEKTFQECKTLRQVFCGGDVLTAELQEEVFRLHGFDLCNLYGPTECTIDTIFWRCRRDSRHPFVPIGRPVANTQAYILDPHLQPTPIGVPGELCLGGVQVGRGYLNRPELTAEKFIPDPFSPRPRARLYKTGDVCRFEADGSIVYLRRLDHQVKIHGLRIEPAEIEVALKQDSRVREAIVLAREDFPGDKRLVAYLLPQTGQHRTFADLRSRLKSSLPDYMIPSAVVWLDAFPLTPGGKIDHRALPKPDVFRPDPDEQYVAPKNSLEETLARIWSDVLTIEHLGTNHNFFELGGDSLQATRIVSKIREELGIEVPLRDIFDAPTVAGLALGIELRQRGEPHERIDRIRHTTRKWSGISDKQGEALLEDLLKD